MRNIPVDRVLIALVVLALAGLWAVVIAFTLVERDYILERARDQLEITVVTLADFNELAEQAGSENDAAGQTRTAAIWRALLQYPAASIWVESGDGTVTDGQPATDATDAILVEEERPGFSVFAALPREEALADWNRLVFQRTVILLVTSLAFLVLAHFLAKTLRQRAAAEASLREHDNLLSAVTTAAGELLGTHRFHDAITSVLELVGKTLSVGRVQLVHTQPGEDGRNPPELIHEWQREGMEPVMHNTAFNGIDVVRHKPDVLPSLEAGEMPRFFLDDLPEAYREPYRQAEMYSFLLVPVFQDEQLWGLFTFADASAEARRQWSWAETDTLSVLSGLTSTAMVRARYVKELADANMIVQNSPTILYRLKGEPDFPLIYISHNIEKFGHHAEDLVNAPDWLQSVIVAEDQELVQEAMARMLEADEEAASIEFRVRTGDGEVRWVENRYTPIRDEQGRLAEVEGIIIDITERKAADEKIAAMARTDGLTGLANRTTFNERLEQVFAATQRGATPFAVFYMDLDRFKLINDTLGHPIGDELLKVVAQRVGEVTRKTDLVARLGGDEFAVLQTEMTEPSDASVLARSIQEELARPLQIDGNDLHVTVSIGICPYTEDSSSPGNMLTQADLALYRAKEDGRNCYRFHSRDLDDQVLERAKLGEDLRVAVEQDELQLMYRPQVSISEGSVGGVEAIVRWPHPRRGMLEAREFMEVAEKTGTIMALGYWIMDKAFAQMRHWRDSGIEVPAMTINLTASQIKSHDHLIRDVRELTEKWGLEPVDIEFDVTEAMLAQATLAQNTVLSELHELGYQIAIDNFGTEYSTIEYLRSYDVSHIKIAQPLVRAAARDEATAGSIRAIVQFAQEMGIGVVAEGVESEAYQSLMGAFRDTGHACGYYYSETLTAEETSRLLQKGTVEPEDES